MRQAINAAIVASGNDAAVALAEKIGGTEEHFADMMTHPARGLGMTRTVFRECERTAGRRTSHDRARHGGSGDGVPAGLSAALFSVQPAQRHHRQEEPRHGQRLLGSYKGADGFKTGFTCGSGYNLVASATRDGRRVIGVVLGSASRDQRIGQMTKLLDAGFARGH